MWNELLYYIACGAALIVFLGMLFLIVYLFCHGTDRASNDWINLDMGEDELMKLLGGVSSPEELMNVLSLNEKKGRKKREDRMSKNRRSKW